MQVPINVQSPNNISKWQMGFNSAFKGLTSQITAIVLSTNLFLQTAKTIIRCSILIYIQQDAKLHSLFYLETALHVSGDISTHHQESKQPV
jgi:hypothetical protein